jgi:hypothetical protein
MIEFLDLPAFDRLIEDQFESILIKGIIAEIELLIVRPFLRRRVKGVYADSKSRQTYLNVF